MGIYWKCGNCGYAIQYSMFNFCPKCSERIVCSYNNTDNLDELLSREVDDYDRTSYKSKREIGYIFCYRCGAPSFYADDNYCFMCSCDLEKNGNINKYSHSDSVREKVDNDDISIDLGKFTNQYLEDGEVCLFHQDDVCWYEFTTNYRDELYMSTTMQTGAIRFTAFTQLSDGEPDNIWNSRAAGTLYFTDKKIMLYDHGFSNIWTKLSIEGDFPEQVMCFPIDEIMGVQKNIELNNGIRGIRISTIYGDCILAPSHRKYRGRKTPIMKEYNSFQILYDKITKVIEQG